MVALCWGRGCLIGEVEGNFLEPVVWGITICMNLCVNVLSRLASCPVFQEMCLKHTDFFPWKLK